MRVGLAIETDIPGGAETVLLELTKELQARGHQVVPLGFSGQEGWLTSRFAEIGLKRDLLDVSGPFGLGSVSEIASTIRKHRLDVLHSHEFGFAVCGSLAARLAGCRHVITMHGGSYATQRLRRRLALRVAAALSSCTVAVSDSLRETLEESLRLRKQSIVVVHNGVAGVSSEGARIRDQLGLGAGDVLALAVGNLFEVKGHDVLIEAVSKLPRFDGRLVVAIAGRGHLEMKLRSLAESLGIASQIHLLGFRADVSNLLDGADIFVMPSLSEGLPMAMIEAMLAGKAIVASDAGGIRELLDNGNVGLMVPPSDSAALAERLIELATDAGLRERLGTAARARALKHFTAAAMADRYLSLYAGGDPHEPGA